MHANDARDARDAYSTTCASGRSSARLVEADPRPGRSADRGHVEDFLDGRGEDAREVRRVHFKLANKIDALELLGKHHRLYVERHVHDFSNGVAERLATALARVDGRARSTGGVRPDHRPSRTGAARRALRKGKRAQA